jgi:hypothetical protein
MNQAAFGKLLSDLRGKARLTNQELSVLAKVPRSLIGGLQAGSRNVGEYQARKIGIALDLQGDALDSFVLNAINTCTDKVLEESKEYHASFLNMIAKQLRLAGILPQNLRTFQINSDNSNHLLKLYLQDGRIAQLSTTLILN